jgi:beta-N-acetylhexosaminidase
VRRAARPEEGTISSKRRLVAKRALVLVALLSVLLVLTGSPHGFADADSSLTRYEQTDTHIAYSGTWGTFFTASASAGSYTRGNTSGASATICFTGERLDWVAMKGTTTGKADVFLDGEFIQTIDLANATAIYQQVVWSSGSIANGPHTVVISRNPDSAAGKYVTLDAVEVLGSLTYPVPTITGLDPAGGNVAGGMSVVISGSGFTGLSGASAVTFGGTNATSYVVNSATKITAVAPAHAEGAVQVQVTAAGGATADTAADDYTYTTAPATTRYEQTDPHIAYSGAWTAFSTASASAGAYARANTSGSSVTITFNGTSLAWIAMKGTTTGKADVTLDGHAAGTVDLANSVAIYQQNVWSTGTLSEGVHTVVISRNAANTAGKYITLDAVDVAGVLVGSGRAEENDTWLSYTGTWASSSSTSASGGSFAYANSVRSSVTVRFTGTRLAWIAKKSPSYGVASVSLDGGSPVPVDLYSPGTLWRQKVWDTGPLVSGTHTVSIQWTGTKNASATNTNISLDAFDVAGDLRAAPTRVDLLSPTQLAGQRVIYRYSGLTPPAVLLSLIRNGQAGGVIFFGGNITSTSQIAAVCAQLEAANAAWTNPVRAPLLLMTDQEGGRVHRLPGEPVISAKEIGASSDPAAAAAQAGAGAASALDGVGMNVNLAPVLDVYRQEGNFIDATWRSYSKDPAVVSVCGESFITASQALGVAATVKHFPGLGAAAAGQNTDRGPLTLDVPVDDLRSIDEFPYQAAIAANVRLVMLSWAIYPALAPGLPAGFSSAVVRGELRGRLGFKGVTITDALGAGAALPFGTPAQRAVLAAAAGVDLVLCSGSLSQGQTAAGGLESAYTGGSLGGPEFQASVQRILALRSSLAD